MAEDDRSVDPTQNVLDLVAAAIRRQDDLRRAELNHVREILAMKSSHDVELRLAESKRIDAVRAVDVAASIRAAEVLATQAATLASQVEATAAAATTALAAALGPIQKDIAALQRAQYEAQGGKTQGSETRLNIGAILGGISVFLVLVFGVISVFLALN